MFRHFLKLGFRNMWKHRSYTGINLFGLTIGLTCCMVITLYVLYEAGYDRFHDKSDKIYRVLTESPGFGLSTNSSNALYDQLQKYPGIVSATRVFRHWFQPLISRDKETGFVEEQFFYADTAFFDVFSIQVKSGNAREGMRKPLHVLLTESTAKRYFGSENPVGQTIKYNAEKDFVVAGVIQDFPKNSHFRPDFIASMSSTSVLFWPQFLNSWGQMVKTYMVVSDPVRIGSLELSLTDIYPKRFGKDNATHIKLQPLTAIHLQTPVGGDFGANNDMMYVRLLAILGMVILIISMVNYMNLTAARGMTRAKEVGVRKALGVQKSNLIFQFLSESVLLSFIAIFLAAGLAEFLLPWVNDLAQTELSLSSYSAAIQIPILVLSSLVIGLLGGIYPAMILTRFDAVLVLKGQLKGVAGVKFRQILVILQFAASVVLIFSTVVIYRQMNFVQASRMGYTEDTVVVIPLKDSQVAKSLQALKEGWRQIPGVASVGMANAMPGKAHAGDYLVRDGLDKDVAVAINWIDDAFLPVMEIPLASGRNVSSTFPADEENSILINREGAEQLGFSDPEDALGKIVKLKGTDGDRRRVIIGVLNNFHFETLHHKIEPLVLVPQFGRCAYLMVRLKTNSIHETLASLKSVWQNFATEQPFSYFFMDENFKRLYQQDERWTWVTTAGAVSATVIASLGLFGLSMFSIQRRIKEIGIRKVLGASLPGLIRLLTKEYILLIGIAMAVAWPAAYYLAQRWLEGFVYHIQLDQWSFLFSGFLVLGIAFLTVLTQVYRAANSSPVEALKYE